MKKEFSFLKMKKLEEVENIIEKFSCIKDTEEISIHDAVGRVIAEDIRSKIDYPPFARSLVDGYAVSAGDTSTVPQYLKVLGEIKMGESAKNLEFKKNCAYKIHTGGMLPVGADAVVMLEETEEIGDDTIEVKKQVFVGENVMNIGGDIRCGELVLEKGRRLAPKDIGILFALSIDRIKVYKQLVVGVIATGDEIVPLSSCLPKPGKIVNSNTPLLMAELQKEGFIVHDLGIVRDDITELKQRLIKASSICDIVIVSGSSSVGYRDYLCCVVDEVIVHGITIKPGKPSLIAMFLNKLIIGLPGHVSSCFLVYKLIAKPILFRLAGVKNYKNLYIKANIASKLSSQLGRRDFVPVRLKKITHETGQILLAEPLFATSSMVSSLVYTDGFFVIPEEKEGVLEYQEGEVLVV